jgi:hypothetical protein
MPGAEPARATVSRTGAARPTWIAGALALGALALGALAIALAVGRTAILADADAARGGAPPIPTEAAGLGALALVPLGLGLVGAGSTLARRPSVLLCRRCRERVMPAPGALGLLCPAGHYARIAWGAVAVTAGFWLAVLGGIALVLLG